jgi:acetyltransferase-like isoleucine patch superfamily enzyme
MTGESSDGVPVLNPQHGVNDTEAELVRWYVKDGDRVDVGQALCEMQTAKAAYDVMSPAAGVIKTSCQPGGVAGINQPVGIVFASGDAYAASQQRVPEPPGLPGVQITDKARRLAESLGLDVAQIRTTTGIVTEKDVRAHHQPRPDGIGDGRGRITEAFWRVLQEDGAFRDLPSEEKVRRYRENGASIGANVAFGPGSIVIAAYIDVGDATWFGDHAFVRADRFRIGTMGVIGAHANMVTRSIWIGDVFYSGNYVSVGGGGAFGQASEFRCGDNCLVSSECIINTTERVVFGNEVGLSPRVQIYTHSHWQDVFEGYAASFGPVTIGDQSYLTGNVMIVPGVSIGRGCTVLANSVVTADLRDRSVASGVPANVVGRVEGDLPIERKDRIMQRLLPELKARLTEQGLEPDGFLYQAVYDGHARAGVVLTFDLKDAKVPEDMTVFDFGLKQVTGPQNRYTDEIRNFFRKRGVRFKPYAWRYVHDVGLFNQ